MANIKDFFISYNKNDKQWAKWIAGILGENGFSTVIQAWDFRPGNNFVIEMQNALKCSRKTIIVLSEDYLTSEYCQSEWAAVFSNDPTGKERKLIPVRVADVDPDGLLSTIIYIDIFQVSEDIAIKKLLNGIDDKENPRKKPPFPGKKNTEVFPEKCKQNNAKGDAQICDDNNEYQEKLKDSLFLEADIDDDKKATLEDVYIKPHIKLSFRNMKQWAENRDSRILLLYGKAGIGKTSYTSWLSLHSDFTQECHILELRKYIDILDSKNSWKSIKNSFNCMNDEEYQSKVLILDGLDEVCVLKGDFDGQEFINTLCNTLRTGIGRNIRIIITSRMGYFNDISRSNLIDVATISWEEDSVADWCNAYCDIHNNRADWCESFKKAYASLEFGDKRREVFCTPLILYICCVSQVDITKHNSVASIYDEAFNVIGTRRYNELTEDSRWDFEINRQFTKELAFQMFLNDKLEDILNSDFVQIAKEKVICWSQNNQSSQVKELEFEKLFAINHFAYGKNNAIEFAHKTIGEYFTAVKLYEDYFKQIDGTAENTWRNLFNAFRYKAIPMDIMQYLTDLILESQNGNWKEKFFKAYYAGIENQLLSVVACFKLEYSTSSVALLNQIQIAFRNLTWLLTGLGFDNDQFNNTSENLQILASYFYGDVNISGWKNLENIDLTNSYLALSNFESAYLKNANFTSANLNSVNFHKTILELAQFTKADVEEAYLVKTNLTGANLAGANLARANLTSANLVCANLAGADLKEANLKDANLKETDCTSANLKGAKLIRADLTRAYLRESNFTGAYLKGTYLARKDFENTNHTGAYYAEACFDIEPTPIPYSEKCAEQDLDLIDLLKSFGISDV